MEPFGRLTPCLPDDTSHQPKFQSRKEDKKTKKKKNISYINLIIISAVFRCNPFSGFQVRARQIPSLSLFFFLIFFLNKWNPKRFRCSFNEIFQSILTNSYNNRTRNLSDFKRKKRKKTFCCCKLNGCVCFRTTTKTIRRNMVKI